MKTKLIFTVYLMVFISIVGSADLKISGVESELKVLREYNTRAYNASPEVMTAARKVFDTLALEGKSAVEIKQLLGPPADLWINGSEIAWVYIFHNGEAGVIRRIHFSKNENKVAKVETILTQ
jgi:hypothetical protein